MRRSTPGWASVLVCGLVLVLAAVASRALEPRAGQTRQSPRLDELSGGEKVHALLEAVVSRQRSLRSLRARFRQVKRSSLLLDPAESQGELRFRAPDLVRWDFMSPEPMVVVFADDTVTTYHPRERCAERVKISRRHRRFVRVLAGTQPLDDLASLFSIALADPGATGPYLLKLAPLHGPVRRKVRSVVIEVDRTLLLPVSVEYDETDGDRTRYEFDGLELNPSLDDSLFRLELGAEVAVETFDASSGLG